MKKVEVKIIGRSEPFTWYEVGSEYTAIYDPHVGKYMAIDRGGASRYIEAEDVEIINCENN